MSELGRRVRARAGSRFARLDQRPAAHWVLLRALPRLIARRFDPVSAAELEATFELAIRHPRGREPARYELAIAGGRCSVRGGAAARPGARATLGADDLIRLASGACSWPELLATGRFQIGGDPFLALRFASLFQLPVRLEPA
jgi:hypothetical protein